MWDGRAPLGADCPGREPKAAVLLEALGRNNASLCFSQLARLGTALQPCLLCRESCSSLGGLTVVGLGAQTIGLLGQLQPLCAKLSSRQCSALSRA